MNNENQLAIFIDKTTDQLNQYLIGEQDVTAYDYKGKVLLVYRDHLNFKKMLELAPNATVELGFLLQTTKEGMIDPDLTRLLHTYKKIPADQPISIEALLDMPDFIERYRDTIKTYRSIAGQKQLKLEAERQRDVEEKAKQDLDQAKQVVDQANAIDEKVEQERQQRKTETFKPKEETKTDKPATDEKQPEEELPTPPVSSEKEKKSSIEIPTIHDVDFTYGSEDPLMMIATKLFVQSDHKQLPHFSEEMQSLLGDQLINTETTLQEAESNTIGLIYQALQGLDYDELVDLSSLIADYNKVVDEQKALLTKYAEKVKEQQRQDRIQADAIAKQASNKELNDIKAKQEALEREKAELEKQLTDTKQEANNLSQQLSQKAQELTTTQQSLQESQQTVRALSVSAVQQETQQDQAMMQQSQMQTAPAPSLNFEPAKKPIANKGLIAVGAIVAVLLVVLIVVLLVK